MKHSNFKTNVHNLVLAAMFLALALVLPFLTGQIPQIGGMLLPMHLPVFLCGLICGWRYGAVVGFVAPLMRMALFGMPPLVAAVAMAFELAAYGGIAGFLYNRSRWQCVVALYRALLAAMVGGRIVWAAVRVVMTGVASVPFTWQIFLTEALVNAIPGIILQLVFIPVLMVALEEGAGLVELLRSGQYSRTLYRRLGQYGVSVYPQHLAALEQAGALEHLEDGSVVLRDIGLYTQTTGLTLEPSGGNALFIG